MGSLRLLPLKSETMHCTIIFCEMCKNAAVEFDPRTKILYPKRRIESYSIMGTIVSPNKILLIRAATTALVPGFMLMVACRPQ